MASWALNHKTKKYLLTGCAVLTLSTFTGLCSNISFASINSGMAEVETAGLDGGLSDNGKDINKSEKPPVSLEADTLIHDEESQIVTASGNVVLEQNGRVLKADKIAYNLKDEVAVAEGNIVFVDQNGDTHFAEYATLTRQMRSGLVRELNSILTDGSRIWAKEAVKEQITGTEYSIYTMKGGRYTACKPCEDNPEKSPPWQLKASKVVHDQEDKMIRYRNARMEVGGVPIFYTPYYAHPDGTVERKSGFLTPSFGYNSELGALFETSYYHTFSPDFDATVGVLLTGKEGPVLKTELRKHYGDALLKMSGSGTYSGRKESEAGVEVEKDEEWRGHLFLNGEWHINNKWRAGANLNISSDDQYLRQYDIDDSDFLMSEIYTERFSGRNYANLSLIAFQDLRVTRSDVDQPNLLPSGEMNFVGSPNGFLGGRWHWNNNVLNIARDGNGQDVSRVVSELGWRKVSIAPFGMVFDNELSLRGDMYNTRDRNIARLNPAEDNNETDGRIAPRFAMSASYPLKRDFDHSQLRLSPQVKGVVMPDMDNDSSIPNEDSQDSQIDISNLFSNDRFNGFDRIEDRSHVSYGLRAGLYGHQGGYFETFLGQSYRLSNNDNPFSLGSGLSDQYSDYVGHINAVMDRHSMNYRFQLDGSNFESERHELYGTTGVGPIDFSGSYLYAAGITGSEFPDSREEVSGSTRIDLTGGWALNASATYDLSNNDEERGLTIAGGGITYTHDCYNVSLYGQRDLRDEASGAGGTSFMFRIGFQNLGSGSAQSNSVSLMNGE